MSEPVRCADELPLLPEPTGYMAHDYHLKAWGERDLRAYAAQAVAERDAEIGRLRGENKALQDGIVRDFVDVGVKNAITELRAEVEALRADKNAWMHEFHATIAEQQAELARLKDEVEALRADGAQAVAAERDACADICDQHASVEGIAQRCAAAIRARGSE